MLLRKKGEIGMEERYNGYTITIVPDENPLDPREDSNLGRMICFNDHRYTLGDKHEFTTKMFRGWHDMEIRLRKYHRAIVILPLYVYDHSGIWMNYERTYPFNDQWDSYQVGYIYCTRKDMLKFYGRTVYGIARVAQDKKMDLDKFNKCLALAEEQLKQEVRLYNYYISGQMVGYIIKDDDGNVVDSCFGFTMDDEDYMHSEAKRMVDYHVKQVAETAVAEPLGVRNAMEKESGK